MRKIIAIMLVLFLLVGGLVACGNGDAEDTEAPVETETPTTPETQEEEAEEPEETEEQSAAEQGEVVTVFYLDVSFAVPAEATIIGDEAGPVGSMLMVVYAPSDADGNLSVIINSMEVQPALLEELGEDGLLETLVSENGEIMQMFGRNVVRDPRDDGGYLYWFFNDDVSLAYLLTIGDVEAGSSAAAFFERVLETLSILG